MDAYYEASKEMDRVVHDINTRFKTHETRFDAFIAKYVQVSNWLRVSADGDNDEEYEYLSNLQGMLQSFIVTTIVSDKGYYPDTQDTFHRWKKDE